MVANGGLIKLPLIMYGRFFNANTENAIKITRGVKVTWAMPEKHIILFLASIRPKQIRSKTT